MMDGPVPAILNAVENAIGRSIDRIPLLPEDMMKAFHESRGLE
jgi:CO/xanthine dehydrogenase Mo-binding subunit